MSIHTTLAKHQFNFIIYKLNACHVYKDPGFSFQVSTLA